MRLLKMPPWTVTPRPAGNRYDRFVGPRYRSPPAPDRLGAVGENPNVCESSPTCAVASRPHLDVVVGAFRTYAAAMSRFSASTCGVVPRVLKEWLPGSLKSFRYRSEEHTSELQSHSFISYAVFC